MAKGSLRVNGIIVDTDGEIKASTNDNIVIREDDGTAAITVDTNGRVIIGDAFTADNYTQPLVTPGLQIEGTLPDSSSVSIFRNSADAFGSNLFLGKSRGSALNADTIVVDNDAVGNIVFSAADGVDRVSSVASIHAVMNGTIGADSTPGELLFKTTAASAQSPTTRMSIISNGNVGINSTVPTTTLDVGGTVTATNLVAATSATLPLVNGAAIARYDGGSSRYNLHIGTSALSSQTGASQYNTAVGEYAGQYLSTSTANTLIGYNAGLSNNTNKLTGSFNTAVGSNAGLSLTSGQGNTFLGNGAGYDVDIGQFNVAVGINANGFTNLVDGAGNNNVSIGYGSLYSGYGDNNVAIGYNAGYAATSFTECVLIGPEAGRQNTTATGQVFIGYQAGYYGTGRDNTHIGHKAGHRITTGVQNVSLGSGAAQLRNAAGNNNVCLGYQANYNATGDGGENVFVGTQAGFNSGNGYNSVQGEVAIGHQALYTMSGSMGNTAIGYEALKLATRGGNTAIGYQAGYTLAGNGYNVAIGYKALHVATTANTESNGDAYNIAVGTHALVANTTGQDNVAIGAFAQNAITTTNRNTAVGKQTAYFRTGSGNTDVGWQAGTGANAGGWTSGDNNTCIGRSAGWSSSSGSNNTLLGYDAKTSSATSSNQICLGNASISSLRCQVTSITSLSDERDKTDIINSPYGLEFIESIQPRQFKWNRRDGGGGLNGYTRLGFVAQELLVATETTDGKNDILALVLDDNPEKLEATQGNLLPIMVQAIKELSAENKVLSTRIASLEN